MRLVKVIAGMSLLALYSGTPVFADNDRHHGNTQCPVGLVSGLTLDEEFGAGSGDLTQCLKRRHKVKVVVQINNFCSSAVANPDCTRPYALGNIANMMDDYEVTHGMVAGRDYEIVGVIHSGGGFLALKNEGYDGNGNYVTGRNQFEGLMKTLMKRGAKFYFCQNTTRGYIRANRLPAMGETAGGATAEMIDGIGYTTAGLTSIADYQRRGYSYIQP